MDLATTHDVSTDVAGDDADATRPDPTPDASRIDRADAVERPSPVPLPGGVEDFHAVVTAGTWAGLQAHAHTRHDVEVGGVLLGKLCRDAEGRAFLLIDGSVAALAAESSAANVTFTADAWTRIHDVIDRDHPGASIVGWYHTHPNFGIFLSEMDVFIQRHFFEMPHQVALVIDPVARTHGIFIWRGGTPTEEPLLIEGGVASTPPPEPPKIKQAAPPRRAGPLRRMVNACIDSVTRLERAQWAALAALVAIAAVLFALLALTLLRTPGLLGR